MFHKQICSNLQTQFHTGTVTSITGLRRKRSLFLSAILLSESGPYFSVGVGAFVTGLSQISSFSSSSRRRYIDQGAFYTSDRTHDHTMPCYRLRGYFSFICFTSLMLMKQCSLNLILELGIPCDSAIILIKTFCKHFNFTFSQNSPFY